jgi:hypothetical protein
LKNKIIGLLLQIKALAPFFVSGLNLNNILELILLTVMVKFWGYVDTALLLKEYRAYLKDNNGFK